MMLDLTSPMSRWTPGRRRLEIVIILLTTLPLSILSALWMGHIFEQADTDNYLNLAAGRPALLPFASRQLAPLLVRRLVRLMHLSIAQGFLLEGTLAMIILLGTVVWLLVRSGAPRWMIPAVAGMFFWTQMYNGLVLPELVYAALLCFFLLLVRQEHLLAAALMMFPLVLARESTLLTLVCFLSAGWRRLRWFEAGGAVLATGLGILVVKHLTANALPNIEGISPALYLFAKIPWNLVKNFLGVEPWANVYRSCEVPRWQIALHLGPLHAIGVCRWAWRYPVWLLFEALATFGLLPLLVWRLRHVRLGAGGSGDRGEVLVRFTVIYGVISFAMAGLLGEAFGRLFAYSWPLFLVALPILVGASGANFCSSRAALAFLGLHLALTWLNIQLHQPLLVVPALVLFLLGWVLLRMTWLPGAVSLEVSAEARPKPVSAV